MQESKSVLTAENIVALLETLKVDNSENGKTFFNSNIFPARQRLENFLLPNLAKDQINDDESSLVSALLEKIDKIDKIDKIENYLKSFLAQSGHFQYTLENKQKYAFILEILLRVVIRPNKAFGEIINEVTILKNHQFILITAKAGIKEGLKYSDIMSSFKDFPEQLKIELDEFLLNFQKELLMPKAANKKVKPVKIKVKKTPQKGKNGKVIELMSLENSNKITDNNNVLLESIDPCIKKIKAQISVIEKELESCFVFKKEILREKQTALKMLLIRFKVSQQKLLVKSDEIEDKNISNDLDSMINFWEQHYKPILQQHRYPSFQLFSNSNSKTKTTKAVESIFENIRKNH